MDSYRVCSAFLCLSLNYKSRSFHLSRNPVQRPKRHTNSPYVFVAQREELKQLLLKFMRHYFPHTFGAEFSFTHILEGNFCLMKKLLGIFWISSSLTFMFSFEDEEGKTKPNQQKEPHILKQSSEGDAAEIPACKQRQKVLCWMKWERSWTEQRGRWRNWPQEQTAAGGGVGKRQDTARETMVSNKSDARQALF